MWIVTSFRLRRHVMCDNINNNNSSRWWGGSHCSFSQIGTTPCVPHTCPCGAPVDAYGIHSLVSKRASGKITGHQAVNDVIARAFVAANMPVTKEPSGLSISDNKRPDGLTLLPWQEGEPLAWDVTVICPLTVSYVSGYSPGASAELAASRKCEKYAILPNSYIFQPKASENLGTLDSWTVALISAL